MVIHDVGNLTRSPTSRTQQKPKNPWRGGIPDVTLHNVSTRKAEYRFFRGKDVVITSDFAAQIRGRLESLPLSKWHLVVFVICALSLLCDSADQFIIISIAPLLIREWGITSAQVGLIAAATGIGGIIGAPLFGMLADRIGRRKCMMISVAIYATFTGITATSQGIGQMIVLRALAGIGLGGVVPVTLAYVGEYAPPRWRGRIVAWWNSMFAFGIPVSGLVGLLIIVPYGWRWGYLAGAVPAVLIAAFVWLPESVRYLLASGKKDAAVQTIERVERAVLGRITSIEPAAGQLVEATKPAGAAANTSGGIRRLLATLMVPGTRGTMIASAVLWFLPSAIILTSFYGVFLTQAKGMDLRAAIALVTASSFLGPIGQLTAGFLSDWVGRKATLTLALTLLGTMPFCAFNLAQSEHAIYVCLVFAWIGTSAIYGTAFGYSAEQLPTELRAGGLGVFEGLRRAGQVVGPIAVGILYGGFGLTPVLLIASGSCLFTILVVLIWGRETRGRPMVELDSPIDRVASPTPGHT
jgi:putative MFS transporter